MDLRERILNRPYRGERVPYDLPEWGAGLFAKHLSGLERADLQDRCERHANQPELQQNMMLTAEMIVACTVDDAGNKVFQQSDPGRAEDVLAIANEDADVVMHLGTIAGKVNKLRAVDLEDARKNS